MLQCVAVHGDISQSQRTAAVEKFKSGEVPLLIATDVAARGLDIPDVEAVINYSFPLTTEDYVHRIGRTGRAGKTGTFKHNVTYLQAVFVLQRNLYDSVALCMFAHVRQARLFSPVKCCLLCKAARC